MPQGWEQWACRDTQTVSRAGCLRITSLLADAFLRSRNGTENQGLGLFQSPSLHILDLQKSRGGRR